LAGSPRPLSDLAYDVGEERIVIVTATVWRYIFFTSAVLFVALTGPAMAQKTDVVVVKKGGKIIGEIKGLQYGKLELSTDAMSHVYIKWPKVLSITTKKQFEIELADGSRFFGSVSPAPDSGSVVIDYDTLTVEVETAAIVTMKRIKPNFWEALDGSINLGVSFTQQNFKTDLNFSASVKYKKGLNNYNFEFTSAFGRQDSVDNVTHVNSQLTYLRELKKRRFLATFLSGERNSQLQLDFRGTVGGGVGSFLVQTNKVNLGFWGGLAYARENYTGEETDNTLPAFLTVEYQYFVWGALNRELSSGLTVLPVLTGETRWRLQFTVSMKWEIAHHLYFNLSLNEDFDSNPPSETANRNSFYTTTSLGWTF